MEMPELIRNCDRVLGEMCKYYGYSETSATKDFNISSSDFRKIADILQTRGFSKTTTRGEHGLQLFATAQGKSFNSLNSFEKEWLKENSYKQPTGDLSDEDYLFLSIFPKDKQPVPKDPNVLEAVKPYGLLNQDVNRLYDRLCPRFLERDKNGVMMFSINDTGLNFLTKYEKKLVEKAEKDNREHQIKTKELQKLELEIEDLVNRLVDYERTKRNAKIALIIAVIASVAAVIQLFL
jgi:adenylate cyclase class IV